MRFIATLFVGSVVLGLVLVIAGLTIENTPPAPSGRVSELVGGPESVSVIRTARLGDAVLLLHGDLSDEPQPIPVPAPRSLDWKTMGVLADLLLADDGYAWDLASACEPVWIAMIRLQKDARRPSKVRFCFSCDHIWFTPGSVGYMGKNRGDFARILKRLFPDDPASGSGCGVQAGSRSGIAGLPRTDRRERCCGGARRPHAIG